MGILTLESLLGPDHPDVAIHIGRLASLSIEKADYNQAEDLYEVMQGPDGRSPTEANSFN